MCEYNGSRHKEVLQNEKPTQNQKGTIKYSTDKIYSKGLSAFKMTSIEPWCYLSSQSVYGLQNDIRTHSPTHTPAPEAKQPTEEELQEQVWSAVKNRVSDHLKSSC